MSLFKKKIFIGSSKEAIDSLAVKKLITALELGIENSPKIDRQSFEIISWDKTNWKNLKSTLESLTQNMKEFSYAVFLFTPDDEIKLRDKNYDVPRDNVIFELGLFLSHLGMSRTFIVTPKTKKTHEFRILSDVIGVFVSGNFTSKVEDTGLEFDFEIKPIIKGIIDEEDKFKIKSDQASSNLETETLKLNKETDDGTLSPQFLLGTLKENIVNLVKLKAIAQEHKETDVISDLYVLLSQISEIYNTKQLIVEQCHTKVREVWVFSETPIEFLNNPDIPDYASLQRKIIENLKQKTSYIYFIPNSIPIKSLMEGFIMTINNFIKRESPNISDEDLILQKQEIMKYIKVVRINPDFFTGIFTVHRLKDNGTGNGDNAYMSVITPSRNDIYIKLQNERTRRLVGTLNYMKGEEEIIDGLNVTSFSR
jgi:predicted nucleotide-binding protein